MKFLKILDEKLEEYFLVATLIFMVVLIFVQVIMRYVFSSSLSWSEELARYIFLWQIWVGASFAVKKSRHIRVEMLKNLLSPKASKMLGIFSTFIWIGFCIFLTTKSASVTGLVLGSGQLTPALRIPMALPYASVPVGSGLMVLRLLQKVYRDMKTPVPKEAE